MEPLQKLGWHDFGLLLDFTQSSQRLFHLDVTQPSRIMRFLFHYTQKKVLKDNTSDLIWVFPPLFYPELLSPFVLSPFLEPSQQSAYKTKQKTRIGGKSKSLLGAIKIQQWRGNPSPLQLFIQP
jgi:hypothetical protein